MPDGVSCPEPLNPDEFAGLMTACVSVNVEHMAVAVSGGADSMALCLLAAKWAKQHGVSLTALSVDHGLRAASVGEVQQVGQWLLDHDIDHHILTWQGGAQRSTALQERARVARYGLMRDWCRERGVGHVLVGHHMEDQAETVLMRLKKGSGLMGLAAMAPCRDWKGLQILRPLLDVPKVRLRATLSAVGQDWIEDPSNQNAQFERVRTRQLLVHLQDEGVSAQRLAGVARACARVRDVLETAADRVLTTALSDGGEECLDAKLFLSAPQSVRDVALTKLLTLIGGSSYPPATIKRDRLLSWMAKNDKNLGPARTLGGCEIRREERKGRSVFLISPERPRKSARMVELFVKPHLPPTPKRLTSRGTHKAKTGI